jgi:hypothetical protein
VIEYDCTPRYAADYSYTPLIRDGAGHANDGILMALRSGYFAYQTSGGWSNLQAFTKDQKYAVKIHNIDLTNNQYDVDIDSVNRGTNIAFRAPETQLTHINLEGSGGEACLNDWDNIRIRKDTANPPTYVFDSESYYANSIHYNISSPYNHTIESDGTIIANRSLIVTDDINWTAAALTDDCHLIVTKYNLSDVIIANFTIYTSSLDWLTVPDLIKYTYYNLLFSNGTLIEKQFTDSINVVYFTTNLTIGSYIIEKGESAHPFPSDASHFYDEMKSGLTNFRDDMSKYLVWAILFFAVGLAFTIFTKIKQTLIGGK